MENKVRFYGYIVAIVAIIAFLISMGGLIGAIFDMSDPLHAGWYEGPSLASFETYKVNVLKGLGEDQQAPDDETLHAMYETAREDRIHTVRFQARRTMTINGLIIFFSIILFTTHLIWVRKLARAEA